MNTYTEDALIEQPTIALFQQLGWQYMNCYHERFGDSSDPTRSTLGRETPHEVVLVRRLRDALNRLNPGMPPEAIEAAITELSRDRSALGSAYANRELYALLKDGVKVTVHDAESRPSVQTVAVIEWDHPEANDYFLASQFWVLGDVYKRRADLVGFVNGIPLVFIELKASHKSVKDAYNQNLRDYKQTVSQIFTPNAFIILSNGSYSRIGSMTASWEHFAEWKKINSEGEEGIISLDTMIRGTCDPARLLDIVENFVAFSDAGGALVKIVARNHQYLGVNNTIGAVRDIEKNKGRLGVFWHTQGSGKSYSMVFFSQKILRKLPGNWTFLVVTDRQELDDQIYKTFAATGTVIEKENQVHASSGAHLQRLLTEDHRYLFTLIHKFHAGKGETYPLLSDRSDIIVITDEAHRSQYDALALNMRNALPSAAFLAFTGTPLIATEERTREVFGDYVSVYNFKESIDDGATVPLYYENRIPELQITNADLDTDMEDLIEEADLDEAQQEKLEHVFARQYHLITRDDRLESVAQDIVEHFMGRGYMGKAMVVCIDKATAVKMYDKVQKQWAEYRADLEGQLAASNDEGEQESLRDRIKLMRKTDMAVVVSPQQNEVEDLKEKGVDIAPHRKRMITEDLDTRFKDPADPFRIVFVCAMWMTGFDAPSVSTIYLDKPMRNHTLMQTIARANRVHGDKLNGVIVDYVGVFRDLQKALAIYGSAKDSAGGDGDTPVKDKSALVETLRDALAEMRAFCRERGVDPEQILNLYGFAKVQQMDALKESVLVNDQVRARFISLAATVARLYKAILPDLLANEFAPMVSLYAIITAKIITQQDPPDISKILRDVEALLDLSIAPKGYVIREHGVGEDGTGNGRIDLATLDLAALRAQFESGQKYAATQTLRAALATRLQQMVRMNKSRTDYLEKFQRLIDEYNSGAEPIDLVFAHFHAFRQELDAEERRTITENLTEEELALYDLLTRPNLKLAPTEREQVKRAALDLLEVLKGEKLVLDWRQRQQSRAQVRSTIEHILDKELPALYTPDLYQQKVETVYQHVYDSYYGAGVSIYAQVA
ncbi:MAG TPA: type I restriction endonuclease subunit R [Chloroflexia bacterium]|nr:type I restriction endonuclease subunit R [Chloroflexia bacterium]